MTLKCRRCGAILQPYTKEEYVTIRTPNLLLEGEFNLHTETKEVPTGKFGYGGDNTFCSKICGYVYGYKAAHGLRRTKG